MAGSAFSLPVVAVVTTLLWIVNGISYTFTPGEGEFVWGLQQRLSSVTVRNLFALLSCGLAAYLIAELNNENALIRIRSRLMSVVFLGFMGGFLFLHPLQVGHIAVVCLLLSYHTFFRTYQRYDAMGYTFHAFFFLSFASLFYSKLLLLVPFFIMSLHLHMLSLSLRSFFAALLGVVLPYWMWAVYLFYKGRIWMFLRPFERLLNFGTPDYSVLTSQQIVAFVIVALLALVSVVHTLRTESSDKIRVRMFFHFFLSVEVALLIGLIIHPESFNILFMLFIANSSTFISHMFALTSSRLTNWFFVASVGAVVIFTGYSLWSIIVNS